MDLTTRYLGLELEHPVLAGASPLSGDVDGVLALQEAGASAVVLESLFEERVSSEDLQELRRAPLGVEPGVSPRAHDGQALGPDAYLELVTAAKSQARIPIIASLNGTTQAGWMRLARALEDAGADALELNVYEMATHPEEGAAEIEEQTCRLVQSVTDALRIPVAVKLTPFYTALPDFARRLRAAGADALVLFNRFFQADFDPETLELVHTVRLSDPAELLLRLRWVAALHGRIDLPLAVTGGVHVPLDVVKSILAGAQVVQVVSVLMRHGTRQLGELRRGLADWVKSHDFASLDELRGRMSLAGCRDPKAFERRRYVQVLQSW